MPARRAITLRDLLTFRLGLGAVMVFPPRYPIQKAMAEAGVAPGPLLPTVSADELMKRFGSLPLVHQPGERWLYHSGSDKLVVFDEAANGRFARPPVFESGGGGLVSTVDDYLVFARMMLDKGRHAGGRILSRPSVELMTSDHITPAQKAASDFFPGFWENRGWGFGLSFIIRRDQVGGSPDSFGWDGGYGTSGYADPAEDMIVILVTQRLWDSPRLPDVHADFWTQAYQAIDD